MTVTQVAYVDPGLIVQTDKKKYVNGEVRGSKLQKTCKFHSQPVLWKSSSLLAWCMSASSMACRYTPVSP